MTRKQIVKRAFIASTILGVVSLLGSGMFLPQLNKVAYSVEPVAVEIDPEIRARIEHGEDNADAGVPSEDMGLRTASGYRIAPQVEAELADVQNKLDTRSIELERLEAEDGPNIYRERMRTPDQDRAVMERKQTLRREINDLYMRQMELLDQYYPPAAGSEPPGADGVTEMASAPTEYIAEPIVERSTGFWDGVNGRYILDKLFAIIYGIGQILIGAWAAVRWKKSK